MSSEIDHKILQHKDECREGAIREIYTVIERGFSETRKLCDMNAKANAENAEQLKVVTFRLGVGNERFENQDDEIREVREDVKKNAVSLAKLAGIVAAGGVVGAGVLKVLG